MLPADRIGTPRPAPSTAGVRRAAGAGRGRIARTLAREPRWLRGLDWRLVGYAALIALAFTVAIGSGWINPRRDEGSSIAAKVLLLATLNAIAALAILLIAAALGNLRRPALPLPLVLAVAVVAGPLVAHLFMAAQQFGDRPPELSTPTGTAMFIVVRALIVALPWGVAAAAWYYSRRAALRASALRAAELDRRRLETGMIEARLRALQAQVEPHFLFNTLAHVKRLYRTDPERARRMLDSFRAYLHSALPQMRDAGTTLGREVDLACAYLDVQQIRMGRRLRVAVDVARGLRAQPFPPMMLLTLVENAVKHGLNPLAQGGTITISATRQDGLLRVTVADTGRGIDDQLGIGVGLANLRDRLAALFGPDGRLTLAPGSPQGVVATLAVPCAAGGAGLGAEDDGEAADYPGEGRPRRAAIRP